MAVLHSQALLCMLGVTVWWLLVFGTIVLTVPPPESVTVPDAVAFAPGHIAYLSGQAGAIWRIPIDRDAYYEHERSRLDNDQDALTQARARPGWVVVAYGQVVRVLDAHRAAVQVELLESPNTGGRGWLNAEHLRPYTGAP